MHRTSIDPNLVPAGALVAFIQRGMQYMEMEANIEVRHEGCCSRIPQPRILRLKARALSGSVAKLLVGPRPRLAPLPPSSRITPLPHLPRTASWRATLPCLAPGS